MRRSDLVDREQVVVEGLLLAGQLERLAAEPRAACHAPAGRRHPPVVTQAELAQPMTGTHPIKTGVLAGADQIAQRLKLR